MGWRDCKKGRVGKRPNGTGQGWTDRELLYDAACFRQWASAERRDFGRGKQIYDGRIDVKIGRGVLYGLRSIANILQFEQEQYLVSRLDSFARALGFEAEEVSSEIRATGVYSVTEIGGDVVAFRVDCDE